MAGMEAKPKQEPKEKTCIRCSTHDEKGELIYMHDESLFKCPKCGCLWERRFSEVKPK